MTAPGTPFVLQSSHCQEFAPRDETHRVPGVVIARVTPSGLTATTPPLPSRARHVTALAPSLSAQLSALNSAAFSTELTLYLVHGWLHLAGYDDLVPAKKRLMRRAESRALKILRARECLPSFRLV